MSNIEDPDRLMPLAVNYFSYLFSSEVQSLDNDVIDKVQLRVLNEMNQILLAPYLREEVKKSFIQHW
jgi:hypothetical protein